jgi:hypothetical protein
MARFSISQQLATFAVSGAALMMAGTAAHAATDTSVVSTPSPAIATTTLQKLDSVQLQNIVVVPKTDYSNVNLIQPDPIVLTSSTPSIKTASPANPQFSIALTKDAQYSLYEDRDEKGAPNGVFKFSLIDDASAVPGAADNKNEIKILRGTYRVKPNGAIETTLVAKYPVPDAALVQYKYVSHEYNKQNIIVSDNDIQTTVVTDSEKPFEKLKTNNPKIDSIGIDAVGQTISAIHSTLSPKQIQASIKKPGFFDYVGRAVSATAQVATSVALTPVRVVALPFVTYAKFQHLKDALPYPQHRPELQAQNDSRNAWLKVKDLNDPTLTYMARYDVTNTAFHTARLIKPVTGTSNKPVLLAQADIKPVNANLTPVAMRRIDTSGLQKVSIGNITYTPALLDKNLAETGTKIPGQLEVPQTLVAANIQAQVGKTGHSASQAQFTTASNGGGTPPSGGAHTGSGAGSTGTTPPPTTLARTALATDGMVVAQATTSAAAPTVRILAQKPDKVEPVSIKTAQAQAAINTNDVQIKLPVGLNLQSSDSTPAAAPFARDALLGNITDGKAKSVSAAAYVPVVTDGIGEIKLSSNTNNSVLLRQSTMDQSWDVAKLLGLTDNTKAYTVHDLDGIDATTNNVLMSQASGGRLSGKNMTRTGNNGSLLAATGNGTTTAAKAQAAFDGVLARAAAKDAFATAYEQNATAQRQAAIDLGNKAAAKAAAVTKIAAQQAADKAQTAKNNINAILAAGGVLLAGLITGGAVLLASRLQPASNNEPTDPIDPTPAPWGPPTGNNGSRRRRERPDLSGELAQGLGVAGILASDETVPVTASRATGAVVQLAAHPKAADVRNYTAATTALGDTAAKVDAERDAMEANPGATSNIIYPQAIHDAALANSRPTLKESFIAAKVALKRLRNVNAQADASAAVRSTVTLQARAQLMKLQSRLANDMKVNPAEAFKATRYLLRQDMFAVNTAQRAALLRLVLDNAQRIGDEKLSNQALNFIVRNAKGEKNAELRQEARDQRSSMAIRQLQPQQLRA